MDAVVYSRKDYMNKQCTYREYYAQFATRSVRNIVREKFLSTEERIKHMAGGLDNYFNDITSLRSWDELAYIMWVCSQDALRLVGESNTRGTKYKPSYSLSDCICILKEACRLEIENHIS